jgi:4-oxalocrotonate tautomerase
MPLVRISVRPGKPAAYRRALADGVHRALVSAIGIPEDDRFQIVAEEELIYDRSYLGIQRSEDAVFVYVTFVRGRSTEKKQALYRDIVDNLARDPGVPPEDVVVTLVENGRDDWSVGRGEAQLVGASAET